MYRSPAEEAAVARQLAALRDRYGDRIKPEQEPELIDHLIAFHRRAETVRAVPLALGDEPMLRLFPPAQGEEAE